MEAGELWRGAFVFATGKLVFGQVGGRSNIKRATASETANGCTRGAML
jgi:hypothetical protein